MKRIPRWFLLVLLVTFVGLVGAACEPDTVDDESELPWTEPEVWESGPSIGM